MTEIENEFTDALVKRIKIRRTPAGEVCVLDLRHARFGLRNPRMLRCPEDAGWPIRGRTTSDPALAENWVREAYAAQLRRELDVAPTAAIGAMTFEQAAQKYIAHQMKVLGADGLRSINPRVSMLRAHVIPAIGRLPLVSITKEILRGSLGAMTVVKTVRPGEQVRRTPEVGTQRNFLRAANAVWNDAFPDKDCPYAGIRLGNDLAKADRRKALAEGDFEALLRPKSGAMVPKDFERAMTAALYFDMVVGGRPCTRALMVPNTVHTIAIQTALGLRISEVLNLRWGHIKIANGYVLVAGTKTNNALRVVPLQAQALPWLEELRQLEGGTPDPRDFVVRTSVRARHNQRGTMTTMVHRVSQALKYAGLKRPKKATHWTRACHASWGAASEMVTTEMLKAYLGHARPYGGATDDYISVMIDLMPQTHRHYIKHIPSPDRVRALLKDFVPTELPPWKERRRVYSRSKAAREEQRKRADARKPMHATLGGDPMKDARSPVAKLFGFDNED